MGKGEERRSVGVDQGSREEEEERDDGGDGNRKNPFLLGGMWVFQM